MFSAFLRSPHLTGLHALAVYGWGDGETGVVEIASTAALSGLRKLDLANIYGMEKPLDIHGDIGAHALMNSPYITRLEKLVFRPPQLNDEVGAELVGSRNLAFLRELDVKLEGTGPWPSAYCTNNQSSSSRSGYAFPAAGRMAVGTFRAVYGAAGCALSAPTLRHTITRQTSGAALIDRPRSVSFQPNTRAAPAEVTAPAAR